MKKKLYTFRFIAIALLAGLSILTNGQDVYFREGFEPGGANTFTSDYLQAKPAYYAFGGMSAEYGTWYSYLSYRTTGTGCTFAVGGSASHIRTRNSTNYTGLTNLDSPFLVSPVLPNGVNTYSFIATRASKQFNIYKTSDTSAQTTNWTFVMNVPSVAGTCLDAIKTVAVADASAKRIKLVSQGGSDSDIDSIVITSMTPIVPVKFTGINAVAVNGMTKVTWNIATELNTRSYIVEKSTDGMSFKNVAEVTATNAGSYSWIDQSINAANVYYRVKSIDKDGKLGYSGVIKLSTAYTKPGFVITPNMIPGRTMNLQLTNIAKGTLTIRISNNMGQIVYSSALINDGGSVSKSISLPGTLQASTYRVQLVSGSTLLTQTAILQ